LRIRILQYEPMLWIRDILVRIRGSVALTYGSGFGSGSYGYIFIGLKPIGF
jgi:hypothetical protein